MVFKSIDSEAVFLGISSYIQTAITIFLLNFLNVEERQVRFPSFWEHCQITCPYLSLCNWGVLLVLTNNLRVEMRCDISSPRFIEQVSVPCMFSLSCLV